MSKFTITRSAKDSGPLSRLFATSRGSCALKRGETGTIDATEVEADDLSKMGLEVKLAQPEPAPEERQGKPLEELSVIELEALRALCQKALAATKPGKLPSPKLTEDLAVIEAELAKRVAATAEKKEEVKP